jgi:hypothetical protein
VQPLWTPSQKFSELFPGGNRTAAPAALSSHTDVEAIINSYGLKGNFGEGGGGARKWGNLESTDFSFGEGAEGSAEKVLNPSEEEILGGGEGDAAAAARMRDNVDGILRGNWGAIAKQDLTTTELTNLLIQIKALNISSLGPRLGVLRNEKGHAFSWCAAGEM